MANWARLTSTPFFSASWKLEKRRPWVFWAPLTSLSAVQLISWKLISARKMLQRLSECSTPVSEGVAAAAARREDCCSIWFSSHISKRAALLSQDISSAAKLSMSPFVSPLTPVEDELHKKKKKICRKWSKRKLFSLLCIHKDTWLEAFFLKMQPFFLNYY